MLFIFKGIATTAHLLPEQQLRSDCKIFEDRFPRQYFGGVLAALILLRGNPSESVSEKVLQSLRSGPSG